LRIPASPRGLPQRVDHSGDSRRRIAVVRQIITAA
jgi:hypothetical protein